MSSVIDWKKVRKECKKLGIFDGHYNPSNNRFEEAYWQVCLSMRGSEKTTGFMLLGMVIHRMYGSIVEYFRTMPDDCRPKEHSHFFDSIIGYEIKGRNYIEILTDDKYNSVEYKAGFWYYRRCNENGEVVTIDPKPFCHVYPVRKAMDLKSNYTSSSSFIIYDEFIDPTKLYKDDFVLLCDCISTIFRQRYGWVCLLANTLDRQSIWFRELCISREVSSMVLGETKLIKNEEQTPVLVNILPANITEAKKRHNLSLFSFKNSKLSAITGTSEGWAMKVYPRLPRAKNEYLCRNIYLDVDGFTVRVDFLINDIVGFCIQIVDTDVTDPLENKDDAIVITTGMIERERTHYLFSLKPFMKVLSDCMNKNKVFFSSNESGVTFDHFVNHSHYWNG